MQQPKEQEKTQILRWADKPYHSLDYELKKRFGRKLYKLSLNAGCTCPNRDGKISHGGCIFCSEGGSGDFAGSCLQPVSEQIREQKALLEAKAKEANVQAYIAYFQAFTNTYAPVSYLEPLFREAIAQEGIVALSIGTRPDCLPENILDMLERLNKEVPVWVELGLQTIHEDTARLIRRGYPLPVYEQAVRDLRARGIDVITHAILGLPGESNGQDHSRIMETMRFLSHCDIQGIKLQLLHVLKDTDLAGLYEQAPFHIYSLEEYLDLVIDCLEVLPPEMTIHRVTGDGPRDLLIAPTWSCDKRKVLNCLHRRLKERGTWQGRLYL